MIVPIAEIKFPEILSSRYRINANLVTGTGASGTVCIAEDTVPGASGTVCIAEDTVLGVNADILKLNEADLTINWKIEEELKKPSKRQL